MKTTYYFMSARTQFDNLGDGLINKTLLDILRQKGCIYLDCKDVPSNYYGVADIDPAEIILNSLQFYLKMLYLRLKGNAVTYILKPGHIFTKKDSPKQLIHDCCMIVIFALFKLIGIKIKRFGASMGPFAPISLKMEKVKSKLCSFIGVRDRYSQQFSNSVFCPDLLFYPEYASPKSLDQKKLTIAFSFRSIHPAQDSLITDLLNYLGTKYHLIAISHVTRDRAYQNKLVSNIPHIIYDGTLKSQHSITETLKGVDIVFSNRLHFLLNGMMAGCHPVAITSSDNTKIKGVFESAYLSSRMLSIEQATPENFNKIITSPFCYAGIDALRTQLKTIFAKEA